MNRQHNWVQNVLLLHYAQLFVTPFDKKLLNVVRMTVFLAIQAIRFCPSELRATRFFFTVLGLPINQKHNLLQKVLILQDARLFVTSFEEKCMKYYEDDAFLGGSNYFVLALLSQCNKMFFTVLSLPMHREHNLVQKCSNFTLRMTIRHSV